MAHLDPGDFWFAMWLNAQIWTIIINNKADFSDVKYFHIETESRMEKATP